MSLDKCRICLLDGASYKIFEDIKSEHSIHSKLFQCLNEKIENKEGYPENICESCNTTLDTVYKFVTKYKASCKLLEFGITVVKEDDTENTEGTLKTEDYESKIIKNELLSDSDGLEPLDDFVLSKPQIQKPDISILKVKAKLNNLKEISIKKKPVRKSTHKTSRIAASILEADFDWNGERWCLRPSKPGELIEDKIKQPIQKSKIRLAGPKKLSKKPAKAKPSKKLCDICGVFQPPDKLSSHKKDQHFSVESKCPQCPHKFSSELYLRRHLKRVHSDKPFVCEKCGKGFSLKGLLATHIKIVHLKIIKKKRLSCDICDRTFCNKKSLLIHDRSAHTGLRPAVCEECGASFYHEDYLREHQRLHTGEAPFKCPICDRGYAQRGNMRSHIKHNHHLADLSPELLKTLNPLLHEL